LASFLSKKGGLVVSSGNSSYVVDGVGVVGWLPGVFCALLRHFSRRFDAGRDPGIPLRPVILWRTRRFFGFFLAWYLLSGRITSIVRFWELIDRRVVPIHLAGLVVCFVGFSGWFKN
jgi:hypothetical protein